MKNLPLSLAIALWACLATCFVGMLAYAFNAPGELVIIVFCVGMVTSFAEWLLSMNASEP
jgi:hypothetical protein